MGEHLTISNRGPVATVMMARPEVHNAFNEALIAELHDVQTSRRDVSGGGAGQS
jgi:enoyl-CoA hydratase/carnithine racemase